MNKKSSLNVAKVHVFWGSHTTLTKSPSWFESLLVKCNDFFLHCVLALTKAFWGVERGAMLKTPWKKKKKENQSRPPCNGQQMLFGKNWMAQREIESCRLNDLHTPICWEYRAVGPIRAREGGIFAWAVWRLICLQHCCISKDTIHAPSKPLLIWNRSWL